MSLYLGNNLIAPNQSNAANKSLSNLDVTGQAIISSKADVDGSNITQQFSTSLTQNMSDAANIYIAHNAMPSDTYIDLTLGASGTSYIAPADGYVSISKVVGGDWYYLAIDLYNSNNVMIGSIFADCYRTSPATVFVPVYKGQKFVVGYNAYGATNWFRFIYAQGSESEAQ